MSLSALTHPLLWSLYSKKLISKIDTPRCFGALTKEESQERGMRLAEGKAGSIEEGSLLILYWLVDPNDGCIVDARFLAYGPSALIGAAEIFSLLIVSKNYDQARRVSAELIDKQVRESADKPAFPPETKYYLNLVIEAAAGAANQCMDIPLSTAYAAPPAPLDIGEVREGGYPDWEALSKDQQMGLIEHIISSDIRPYIEMDAGGVALTDFSNGHEVHIAYSGSCTSCFSATGTTLAYIQQVLRAKLHKSLVVIPDL